MCNVANIHIVCIQYSFFLLFSRVREGLDLRLSYIVNSSRDDKLSKRVKKSRKKKMGPSWGLNPGPSEY